MGTLEPELLEAAELLERLHRSLVKLRPALPQDEDLHGDSQCAEEERREEGDDEIDKREEVTSSCGEYTHDEARCVSSGLEKTGGPIRLSVCSLQGPVDDIISIPTW